MSAPTTPEEAISQAALGPKSVTVGNQTTVARDIKELIDADNYQKNANAAGKSHFGVRFSKIVPPGAG